MTKLKTIISTTSTFNLIFFPLLAYSEINYPANKQSSDLPKIVVSATRTARTVDGCAQ